MTISDNFLDKFYSVLTKILDKILLNKKRSELCATEKILKNGGLTSSKLEKYN